MRKREGGLLKRRIRMGIFLWVTLSAWLACSSALGREPADELPDGLYAEIGTPRGTMITELFFQRVPLTVANFVGLAEGVLGPKPGVPYFDGLTFHRVVPGFVVQGGDPAGTGEGGPGYSLPDELDPELSHDSPGVLSMANDGPDTNGSQFFITLAEARRLDFLHSAFGKVIQGGEVIGRIQQGDRMTVAIRRVGETARQFRVDRPMLEARAKKIPPTLMGSETSRYFDDPDRLLPTSPPRAKYFGYQLANLDRFTDARIFARVFSSASKRPGLTDSEMLRTLSTELDVNQQGVLAVYWSDQDRWDIVVGKEDAARFHANLAEQPVEDRVRQVLLAAERRVAQSLQQPEKGAEPLSTAQQLKLKVDSVVQELISAMQPRRKELRP